MRFTNLSEKQVAKLATTLANKVKKTGAIIGLSGNLGAGKTTFSKAFAKSLGITSLKSPTFIVNQEYRLKDRFLYHMDFYRLDQVKQLEPIGISELLMRPNIVLIEWVEKFPQIAINCDILINLKVKPDNKRDVTIKFN